VGGQCHALAALPPEKNQYPSYRRLGGPQGQSGRDRKIWPQPGLDPWMVQPIGNHTDRAILPHAWPYIEQLFQMLPNASHYMMCWLRYVYTKLMCQWQHLLTTNPIILHDNARAHTANVVTDLLRLWRLEILEQPPYSPDMSPCDYDLFTKMKEPLRGIHYNTREAIIRAVGRSLLDINRSGRADGVRRLPQIWQKVVHMGGDYIEWEAQ
jgi:transposase